MAEKVGKNDKNGTAKNSVNHACNKMARLTKLTDLAANQTKLDELVAKGKLNATEEDAIKAKATNATQELKTMMSNTTLVSECAVVDAHEKVVKECSSMKKLTKLSKLANNETALKAYEAKHNMTAAQMTKFQEKIGNATTKLQDMQKNTTLTDLCAKEKSTKGNGTQGSSE